MDLREPKRKVDSAKDRAQESLQRLARTIEWLAADPEADDRWGRLDATAKRFEVAFEYIWKALKAALEFQGEEVYGPKDSISVAGNLQVDRRRGGVGRIPPGSECGCS